MRLCLGTVQFGLDYGIKGQHKPEISESVRILEVAYEKGISAFDTATAYGNAEEILGEFLLNHRAERSGLFVSTKMKPNVLDECEPDLYESMIRENLLNSLKKLNTDYVDAYILHSARYAFRDDILNALSVVKREGLAKKVGVSVYEPEEALRCFKNENVNFIQAPYSIFDHRMKENGVFADDKRGNCEIHTRSAFIQGLITMNEEQVPAFLEDAKPIIRKIKRVCEKEGVTPVELALAYVKRENAISHLVFGVDNREQLEEDIELFGKDFPQGLLNNLEESFKGIKAEIVMPSLWKR